MKYALSQEARNDLENIWLYTHETWSLEQADRYYRQLFDEIEYLSDHPNSGKDVGFIRKGYLRSKVQTHFIFYKINKKKNEIEIIRILHQQMDIENRLGK
jgi:toxin ParE1/3/4